MAIPAWRILRSSIPNVGKLLAQGVSIPKRRAALVNHWCVIKDQKLENYPAGRAHHLERLARDPEAKCRRILTDGQYADCRPGTAAGDPAYRTFLRPCMACAVHLYDEDGKQVNRA